MDDIVVAAPTDFDEFWGLRTGVAKAFEAAKDSENEGHTSDATRESLRMVVKCTGLAPAAAAKLIGERLNWDASDNPEGEEPRDFVRECLIEMGLMTEADAEDDNPT